MNGRLTCVVADRGAGVSVLKGQVLDQRDDLLEPPVVVPRPGKEQK